MQQNTPTGFFGALFDFSFSEYVVTRMIKVLYILAIICAGLSGFGMFLSITVAAFQRSAVVGIFGLIFGAVAGALVALLAVILSRVWLETLSVIFRICEYTAEIAGRNDRVPTTPAAPPPTQPEQAVGR